MVTGLSNLQRLILATLEEAGEDHLSALTNTVISVCGRRDEILAMQDALLGLQRVNFINLARSRDEATLELLPMDESSTQAMLQHLEAYLAWSDSKNIWTLVEGHSDLEVLLTEAGIKASRKILSEDGFPTSKVTVT